MTRAESVVIELLGGPAHGTRATISGDPEDPPATYEVEQAPDRQETEPHRLLYRRDFRTLDRFVWVYRYEDTDHLPES